ncbi:sperm-associated antigen 7 homolog [Ruditapes philippinarum]|uniref:sperm-associated antigen 7 homolog n=1 Tax=Ruditapes philippinarum TaxID=129788 RepID=UPI00295AA8F5|nr:sperm-associated antigen 7 homolog [Ruditapes philippinarum]
MDLLGSILGSMEKPPSASDAEKKKIKAQKEMIEKQQEKERKKLQDFREQIQKKINSFIKNGSEEKLKLEPMDKTQRAIVHEVADIASLASFSFGIEEQDRYVMLWKKEFAPSDEELLAYRREEEWDPEKAKQIAQLKAQEEQESSYINKRKVIQPNTNYKDKYKHLIGDTAAKDAAQSTFTNRSYGFVSSENKRDQRTIEQVLAETRAKKKLKTDHSVTQSGLTDGSDNQSVTNSETQVNQSAEDVTNDKIRYSTQS